MAARPGAGSETAAGPARNEHPEQRGARQGKVDASGTGTPSPVILRGGRGGRITCLASCGRSHDRRSLALESTGLRSGDGERGDPGVVVWPGGRGRGPGRDHAAAERHERAGEAGGASVARRSLALGGEKPKARPAGLLAQGQAGLGHLSILERFIRFLRMCRMPFPPLQ